MPTSLCNYKGQVVKMTEDDITKSLQDTERAARTGKFNYPAKMAVQPQVEHLKSSWPKEAQDFVRAEARKGGNVTEDSVQAAIVKTCREFTAPKRAAKNRTSAENEFAYMLGESALASLFRISPDIGIENAPRCYRPDGKKIRVKTSSNPKRLVVDEEKKDEADIYVQALLVKGLEKAMLLGWATKADILAAQKGNSSTSPEDCSWTKMAYYIPIDRLRPMAEFVQDSGIKDVPSGILFERPPRLSELPMIASAESQLMLISAAPAKEEDFDEFLRSSGIVTNSSAAPAQVEEGVDL